MAEDGEVAAASTKNAQVSHNIINTVSSLRSDE